jgi:hypothetical protein
MLSILVLLSQAVLPPEAAIVTWPFPDVPGSVWQAISFTQLKGIA